jgi:hypothetical protein
MVDPRYADLPLTQADWSNLLQQAQPQAQAQVQQAPATPNTGNVPTPPVRPMSFAPQSQTQVPAQVAAPNYPTPPPRPADLTPTSPQNNWNTDTSGVPDSLTTFSHIPVIASGQSNNYPGYDAHPYALFPKTTAGSPLVVASKLGTQNPLVTALLSRGTTGSW